MTEQHEAIEAQRGREGDHIRSIGVERIVELRATLRKAAAADIEHVDVVRRGKPPRDEIPGRGGARDAGQHDERRPARVKCM